MKKSLVLLSVLLLIVIIPLARASPTDLWVHVTALNGYDVYIGAYADPYEYEDGDGGKDGYTVTYYTKSLWSGVESEKGRLFVYLTMDQPDSPAITYLDQVDSEGFFWEYLFVETIDPETGSYEVTGCYIEGSYGKVIKDVRTTNPGKYSTLDINIDYIAEPYIVSGHVEWIEDGIWHTTTWYFVEFGASEYIRDSYITLTGYDENVRHVEFDVIGSYYVSEDVDVWTEGSAYVELEILDLDDETELIGMIEVITDN
ncbi:MAG: hypothetical protein DRP01_00695 [Archaeoglobales archaeon]|nr:MAG: hypothetical protein DRP01_00695 [Archaeoglobales archaeon]